MYRTNVIHSAIGIGLAPRFVSEPLGIIPARLDAFRQQCQQAARESLRPAIICGTMPAEQEPEVENKK